MKKLLRIAWITLLGALLGTLPLTAAQSDTTSPTTKQTDRSRGGPPLLSVLPNGPHGGILGTIPKDGAAFAEGVFSVKIGAGAVVGMKSSDCQKWAFRLVVFAVDQDGNIVASHTNEEVVETPGKRHDLTLYVRDVRPVNGQYTVCSLLTAVGPDGRERILDVSKPTTYSVGVNFQPVDIKQPTGAILAAGPCGGEFPQGTSLIVGGDAVLERKEGLAGFKARLYVFSVGPSGGVTVSKVHTKEFNTAVEDRIQVAAAVPPNCQVGDQKLLLLLTVEGTDGKERILDIGSGCVYRIVEPAEKKKMP